MDFEKIEKKWASISLPKSGKGYEAHRIDGSCIPELMVGFNNAGNRCLILELPLGFDPEFTGEKMERLSSVYDKKENSLILELHDNYFHEEFNHLIVFLYSNVKDLKNHEESTKCFISIIRKWAVFFNPSASDRLSEEALWGIIGELTYLRELINSATSSNVNSILNSWKGPYDTNHDFYFDDKSVEVKTKSINGNAIKISSEHQLDLEQGLPLELMVVSLDKVPSNGETFLSLVNEIRDELFNLGGDSSILINALGQKKLSISELNKYDDFKFTLKSHIVYNCMDIDFPKIIRSKTNDAISRVKYSINLASEDQFITSKIDF